MNKHVLILLLLVGSCFAQICPNQTAPVCGSDFNTYANESVLYSPNGTMLLPPIVTIYCGTCQQYDNYIAGYDIYGNYSISQLNNTNSSYLVRFMGASFGALVGNDMFGKDILAILVGGFFFCFVSFQNTRIEAKMAVLIPAFILAAAFVNWLLSIIALIVGVILYISLSKVFNK